MSYQNELNVVLSAVQKAAVICTQVQQAYVALDAVEKNDRSPVTIADFASQAVINLDLMNAFPGDPIIGEEDSELLRKDPALSRRILDLVSGQCATATESGVLDAIDFGAGDAGHPSRFWTVDPIDGTKGFLRKDQYAIAAGLVVDGEVVVGALGCPNYRIRTEDDSDAGTGAIFYATKDEGAFMAALDGSGSTPITVDGISDSAGARFCESVETAHASHEEHGRISSRLGITAPPYRIDSQAKYAAVAKGDASIYLRLPRSLSYREKIWDHAAGCIIVEQAGGRVTDFSGRALDFTLGKKLENNIGILATNGSLHDATLAAIKDVVKTT